MGLAVSGKAVGGCGALCQLASPNVRRLEMTDIATPPQRATVAASSVSAGTFGAWRMTEAILTRRHE